MEWDNKKSKRENRAISDVGNFSSIIGNSIPRKECVACFHGAKKKKRRNKKREGGKKRKKKSKRRKKKKRGKREKRFITLWFSKTLLFPCLN